MGKLIEFVVQVLRELKIDLYYVAFRAIVGRLENIIERCIFVPP